MIQTNLINYFKRNVHVHVHVVGPVKGLVLRTVCFKCVHGGDAILGFSTCLCDMRY